MLIKTKSIHKNTKKLQKLNSLELKNRIEAGKAGRTKGNSI